MRTVVSVDPRRCRVWAQHGRLEKYLCLENCRAEIDSFATYGQLVMALGRRLQSDPDHDVEIVCGVRRLFVARQLGQPLQVEIRDLTDQEAIVAIDIENRQRAEISPYERGVSYAQWLRRGVFSAQEQLARALNVSPSQVSRLLTLAQLPSALVAAFPTFGDIREEWGVDLVHAMQDPQRRAGTLRVARELAARGERIDARTVFQRLIAAAASGRKLQIRVHDEVVKDSYGQPLFRIRYQSKSVAVLVPISRVRSVDDIRFALIAALQCANPEVIEYRRRARPAVHAEVA